MSRQNDNENGHHKTSLTIHIIRKTIMNDGNVGFDANFVQRLNHQKKNLQEEMVKMVLTVKR